MTDILFYNDAPFCGGHERMTAQIANYLSELNGFNIHFAASCQLVHDLVSPEITKHFLPFASDKPLPFITNLQPANINFVRSLIRSTRASLVVVSQGNIELGLFALIASRLEKIPVASYIPVAYSFEQMDSAFARGRDMIDRIYYRLPNWFITINQFQKQMLSTKTDRNIYLIRNMINMDIQKPPVVMRTPITETANVAVIGRVRFKHKNQAMLIPLAEYFKKNNLRVHFHIFGDGPDLEHLQGLSRDHNVTEYFTFHDWLDHNELTAFIIKQIDLIFIPFRFEGLPLVMMEALMLGKTLLILNSDSLDEYQLPDNFLFDSVEPVTVAEKIMCLLRSDSSSELMAVRDRFIKFHNQKNLINDIEKTFHSITDELRL